MSYVDDPSGNIRAYLQEAAEMERNAAEYKEQAAEELIKPFYLVRPKIYIDGKQWCALYGDDLQTGIAGFGSSPSLAAESFNAEWLKEIKGKENAGELFVGANDALNKIAI